MPSPEDMLWRAAAAVARRRGFVTDARVDVDEPLRTLDYYGSRHLESAGRRSYRVTVTMVVEDLDYTTASAVQLSEIVQRHIPPERDETLEAIRIAATGTLANPNASPPGSVPVLSSGTVSIEHVHDTHCNVSRWSPRTPGQRGCSCLPIPTTAPEMIPPPPVTNPAPTPPKEEGKPMDDSSTRFSLLELDL